jgi:hypothetical protein
VLTVLRVSTFIDQRNGNVKSAWDALRRIPIIGFHPVRLVCGVSYNQIFSLLTAIIGNDSGTPGSGRSSPQVDNRGLVCFILVTR